MTMLATRTLYFSSGFAFANGIKQLHWHGITPSELLFLAFDKNGDVKMQIAAQAADVSSLKVGRKLGLPWPFEGQMYYLDAVHPLGPRGVVINGDRRISKFFSLIDVAVWLSWFVKIAGDQSVFFGVTPHQPGSWWIEDEHIEPLHPRGFVDIVVHPAGLLARRIMDPGLYFLANEDVCLGGLSNWRRLYESTLGNVLMLERRIVDQRLVLNCQEGLVEVDLSSLGQVQESGRLVIRSGHGVVGRISQDAFAVTRGKPMDWGYDELQPATLVGSKGWTFPRLCSVLQQMAEEEPA